MTISPKTIERVSEAILDAFDLTSELPLFRWYNEEEMRRISIAAIKAARKPRGKAIARRAHASKSGAVRYGAL